MENKVIKLLLIAIPVTLVLLLIPSCAASENVEPMESGKAYIIGKPDAEGWVKVSLPFFKEPVMAMPSMKGPNIAYITVKVSAGMEIMVPARCTFGKGGGNGRDTYLFWERDTENQERIVIESEKISYQAAEGSVDVGGEVLGTFASDGEANIMTEGVKPQEIAQTDIAAWFNKALEMVLGE